MTRDTRHSSYETFGDFDPGDPLMLKMAEHYAKLRETNPEQYEAFMKNVEMRNRIKRGEVDG